MDFFDEVCRKLGVPLDEQELRRDGLSRVWWDAIQNYPGEPDGEASKHQKTDKKPP